MLMNKLASPFVFASVLLLAIGAVSLSGINTAHAQGATAPTVTSFAIQRPDALRIGRAATAVIKFSESVRDLTRGDFSPSTGVRVTGLANAIGGGEE